MKQELMFYFLFVVTGAAFVFSPLWGLISRRLFIRLHRDSRYWLVGVQAVLCLPGIVIVVSKWSFTGLIIDALALFLGYLAYSGLAFTVSALRPRRLTWVVTALAMVPTFFGILVTVTVLGLAFSVDEYVPARSGSLGNGYSYRLNNFGNATTSDGGTELRIFHRPRFLPFVEHQISFRSFDYRDCDYRDVSVTRKDTEIIIRCPKNSGSVEATVVLSN